MKFILSLLILISVQAYAASEVIVTDSYQTIQSIINKSVKSSSTDELLVVFDLDDTVLRTLRCAEADQTIKNGFQRFKDRVKKCGVILTNEKVVTIINNLQAKDYHVMALTARGRDMASSTLKQLNVKMVVSEQNPKPATIDFVTAPFYNSKKELILFDQMGKGKKKKILKKKLLFQNGVGFATGANKGLALQAYLDFISEDFQFQKIIFIDDNVKNIKNMDKAFQETSEEVTVIHYTEFDH